MAKLVLEPYKIKEKSSLNMKRTSTSPERNPSQAKKIAVQESSNDLTSTKNSSAEKLSNKFTFSNTAAGENVKQSLFDVPPILLNETDESKYEFAEIFKKYLLQNY